MCICSHDKFLNLLWHHESHLYKLIYKKCCKSLFATFHFSNLLIKILPYTEARYYFYMFSGTWALVLGNTNRIPSYSCCKTWIFLPDVQRPEQLAAWQLSRFLLLKRYWMWLTAWSENVQFWKALVLTILASLT